jgi:hypothetical protein
MYIFKKFEGHHILFLKKALVVYLTIKIFILTYNYIIKRLNYSLTPPSLIHGLILTDLFLIHFLHFLKGAFYLTKVTLLEYIIFCSFLLIIFLSPSHSLKILVGRPTLRNFLRVNPFMIA